jgi:hypothetical protein
VGVQFLFINSKAMIVELREILCYLKSN